MATISPSTIHGDEDYIDMEVTSSSSPSSSSSSNVLCYKINSPSKTTEFEFHKASTPNEAKPSPSPADELFYKGKLLPLHLPPRLQMVQNLLKNSTTTAATTANTPLESCNISPIESCRVSCELNPDEYFFEWSTEWSGFVTDTVNNPRKYSWSKKLKLVKQSILAQKLKASRAYLKTLFTKSVCSNENPEAGNESKCKENFSNKYMKVTTKKNPFGQIGKGTYPTIAAVIAEESANTHRKSFSGAIKRHYSATKSSSSSSSSGASSLSSSFSINSNVLYDFQLLKRSCSASSELEEGSIEGAIAHCKKSQLCSLSDSRVSVSEDKER
ncbi:hypothetical protein Vadar_031019 [Vaccinium darrowii]|uniref:Uncharacterized protein n=1 Tax=Vaccinium darrowii TaxID=229202 RepID=A0ACB7ZQ47_9ERIC|nr:hypothetical protein Vadar_031019 [Vaccinium darrowii]